MLNILRCLRTWKKITTYCIIASEQYYCNFYNLGADHLTFEGSGSGWFLVSKKCLSRNQEGWGFSPSQCSAGCFSALWHFFLSYSRARIFLFHLCCRQFLFLPTSACRIFFSKSPTPPPLPQNKMVGPYSSLNMGRFGGSISVGGRGSYRRIFC